VIRAGEHPELPASSLETELRRIAREEAQRAVREALRDAPGPNPRYTTIAAHARRRGLGASTLRRWAKAAGVRVQENGFYLSAVLDEAIAAAGKPPSPPAARPPVDLATERARRAVESMTKGGRR
jgi:hypothetical protein